MGGVSIIQEALRKSQNSYLKNKEPQKSALPPKKTAAPKPGFRIDVRPAQKMKLLTAVILIVISGMIIISVYFLVSFFSGSKFLTKEKNTAPALLPEKEPSPAAIDATLSEPLKQLEIDHALPLPPAQPALVLNGIMYLDEKPQAIINGYILEEGDAINGSTVMLIDKDYVLLNSNDSKVKLKLNK